MHELMKAIAIVGEKKTAVVDVLKPEPEDEEVQVKIHFSALCTFEQRIFNNNSGVKLPYYGGHEISGEISKIGKYVDPQLYPVGKKVAVRVQPACGSCYYCRRGKPTQCVEYKVASLKPDKNFGGMAEYICVDKSRVYPYNDDINYSTIALTEPVACVINSIEKANPKIGDDAVVIGGGVMGQLHIKLLKKRGLRVILSEPDDDRRELAKINACDVTINPINEDAIGVIKHLTDGRGANAVFNTTALYSVEEDAIKMTAPLGTCVTYSSQHPNKAIEMYPGWLHSNESILTGVVNPSIESFDRANNVLNKKIIEVNDLISKTYTKEEADKAFIDASSMNTYRVGIIF